MRPGWCCCFTARPRLLATRSLVSMAPVAHCSSPVYRHVCIKVYSSWQTAGRHSCGRNSRSSTCPWRNWVSHSACTALWAWRNVIIIYHHHHFIQHRTIRYICTGWFHCFSFKLPIVHVAPKQVKERKAGTERSMQTSQRRMLLYTPV